MKCFIISCFLAFTIFPLSAQGLIEVQVSDFKEKNDSLNINYSIRVSPRSIQTGQMLQIRPIIKSTNEFKPLTEVTILGKNKAKVLSRFIRIDDTSYISASISQDTLLTYSLQLPYELWMDSANLVLEQKLIDYRNQSTLTIYQLKDRVELSPREPYQVNPVVALIVPQKEVKIRKRQGKAYLDFQIGRSVILPNYRRNPEELLKIDDAIADVVNNTDATLQDLYIEGYASPDGSYATNERLSRQRAESLKEYIRSKFSLNDNLFKVSSVAEDWEGLEEMVKSSDMPNKERIVEIISSIGTLESRKAALIKLDRGVLYRLMLKDMFPELRRVEYQIDYTVKDYDIKQTLVLLDKKPGDLSQLELYNLALSYQPESKEYQHILLEVIPKYFPEEPIANSNAAAILIQNRELATAKRLLDKAGDSASAINNTGIVLMLEGKLDQAQEAFNKAQNMGNKQASLNLEELKTKRVDNKKEERYQKNK